MKSQQLGIMCEQLFLVLYLIGQLYAAECDMSVIAKLLVINNRCKFLLTQSTELCICL